MRQTAPKALEALENRRMMAAQINFTDFSSTTGLVTNGFGGNAVTDGTRLHMTPDSTFTKRSVWYETAVPDNTFKSTFSFRSQAGPTTADGLTFVVQGLDTTQLGQAGKYLGYTGITQSSGVTFNFFNNTSFGSTQGFVHNGQVPRNENDVTPVDFHSGDLIRATVVYDGHNMQVDLKDANDTSKTFSVRKVIDVPALVGSDMAFVGFTASTGTNHANQYINSWSYSGSNGPTIATAAAADPNPVTGKTTGLSVTATDDAGESDLKYTWSLSSGPTGAKTPTFSANGTNASKSITASFFKDGSYRFRVTATDSSGLSASSLVTVAVEQTATSIHIEPHKQPIANGATQQYTASTFDQFNRAMRTQPEFAYSATGPGSIDADSGLFTASRTAVGHVVITATAGDLTGTVGATVLAMT